MLEKETIKNFFINYRLNEILNSGQLYVFDENLTKEKHNKIKKNFKRKNK